jgi:hypothetical protein
VIGGITKKCTYTWSWSSYFSLSKMRKLCLDVYRSEQFLSFLEKSCIQMYVLHGYIVSSLEVSVRTYFYECCCNVFKKKLLELEVIN